MTIGFRWFDHSDNTYEECQDCGEECYFNLSWFTMRRFSDLMVAADMAYISDHGPWPNCVEGSAEADQWFRFEGVQERPGIPTHKISSNDEWQITDIEIRGALRFENVRDFAPDERMWAPFIDWLESAVEHGGAVVS